MTKVLLIALLALLAPIGELFERAAAPEPASFVTKELPQRAAKARVDRRTKAALDAVQIQMIVALFMIGLVGLAALRTTLPFPLAAALALPAGVASFAMLFIVALAVRLPVSEWSMRAVAAAAVGGLCAWRGAREGVRDVTWRQLAVVLPVVCTAAWIAASVHAVTFFGDAAHYSFFGRTIADFPQVQASESLTYFATNWAILLPLMHGTATLFGGDVAYALPALMALSFAAAFALLLLENGRFEGLSRGGLLTATAILPVACLYSSTFVQMLVVWQLPNHLSMILLGLAAFLLARQQRRPDARLDVVAGVLLGGFSLSRLEGLPVSLTFAGVYLTALPVERRRTMSLLVPGVLVPSAWPLTIWLNRHPAFVVSDGLVVTEMLSGRLALVFFALSALAVAIGAAFERLPHEKIAVAVRKIGPWLAVGVIVVATGILPKIGTSVANLGINLFGGECFFWSGTWDGLWYLLAAGVVVARWSPPRSGQRTLLLFAIYYASLTVLATVVRRPYRVHCADSGNRIMLAVVPVLLYYVAAQAQAALGAVKGKDR